MFPLQITPESVGQELAAFNKKLAQATRTLSELGEITLGASAKEVVYREDKLTLYHFTPLAGVDKKKRNPVPVLIVYALVNRPYMCDLQSNRSIVHGLLEGGLDVYLIDWGYPDAADRYLQLDDYINGYIDHCVDVLCERHDVDAINLLGICQGGTFCTCYAATHVDKVRNLITTISPIDFHTPNDLLSHLSRQVDVDQVVDTLGNVPGDLLNLTFLSLKPYRLMGQKYLDMVNTLDDTEAARNFMRIEKWIFDSPDQVGEAYRQFLKDFYQGNKLIKGEVQIGEHKVSLKKVTMPVLNIYAKDDHLVPPAASTALRQYVGSKDYSELEFPGGHVGIYVSGRAMKLIPPAVCDWLAKR